MLCKMFHNINQQQSICISLYSCILLLRAFPTGSIYGFGKKQPRQTRTPTISKSASSIKNVHAVIEVLLFHKWF